ncbi:major facilitator superfamily domain-containing protein [Phyllosticta citricarpa]|uniref:Major facilitator superfamily domain-containing protein n=2 Tax=Phyllosticta TaxID=121621 RepID=A0ABR1MJ14_9PEZI
MKKSGKGQKAQLALYQKSTSLLSVMEGKTETMNIKAEENGEKKTQPDATITTPSSPPPPPETTAYTTFTARQKRHLRLLIGLATITSPLTATIYFPLLPLLATHFHTSSQAINLTLTLYIIFQALSPALFGPLSDALGRRLVHLLTLFLYLVANVGLAIRAAVPGGSYGVVADVYVPGERGGMLGPVSVALNLDACVGPVAGGAIAYSSGGIEWVF